MRDKKQEDVLDRLRYNLERLDVVLRRYSGILTVCVSDKGYFTFMDMSEDSFIEKASDGYAICNCEGNTTPVQISGLPEILLELIKYRPYGRLRQKLRYCGGFAVIVDKNNSFGMPTGCISGKKFRIIYR
jgi:hypothetical protein